MTLIPAWIRKFDGWLSYQNKIFTFCPDSECILRLQITRARHAMQLEQVSIERSQTVLALHLWNDRLPPVPAGGDSLTWAVKTQRMFHSSLRMAARYVQQDSRLVKIRAVMGVTTLFAPPRTPGERHPMQRLGFTVVPYQSTLGRFGEFWENFYSWLLVWAYNPSSARNWNVFKMRRSEIWMPVDVFIDRYGTPPG